VIDIRPRSEQRPDGRWLPEVLVLYQDGGSVVEQELFAPDSVALDTQEEANRYTTDMGKRWLDKR
jgi:hypothetical protein